jgi:CPA1 family monovalent cation:H+ antiporter
VGFFSSKTAECVHAGVGSAQPRSDACEGCGSRFNLRVCTEFGHVGCCESQPGHDRAHYRESGHPVIKSLPLGPGAFTWRYTCRRYP